MIYFNLPEFYFNFQAIKTFLTIPKYYFKTEVAFSLIEGSFPYFYWNGNLNNNIGKLPVYDEINDCLNSYSTNRLCFNCSNIYLNKDDFLNTYENLILSLGEDGSNCISISNLHLYEYLKEKYPKYKFKLSNNFNLMVLMTPEIINIFLKERDFDLIQIPENQIFNFDFLDKIDNPKKIEIPINSLCQTNCSNYTLCKSQQNLYQYNFLRNNICLECKNRQPYVNSSPLISLEDIVEKYEPKGFCNFSIAPIYGNGENNLFVFLVKYFIKEEFQIEILLNNNLLLGGGNLL